MAIYLNLKANENKVDDKIKAKLLKNFAANEDQRRLKKVTKLRGTVRQLYTTGQFDAGDALWNALNPTYQELAQDTQDVSDSDTSNQS